MDIAGGTKRWFPKRCISLCGNATTGAAMLPLPSCLQPNSCLAAEEGYEKKLVAQQKIIPQEIRWSSSSRKRRLPQTLIAKHNLNTIITGTCPHNFSYLVTRPSQCIILVHTPFSFFCIKLQTLLTFWFLGWYFLDLSWRGPFSADAKL